MRLCLALCMLVSPGFAWGAEHVQTPLVAPVFSEDGDFRLGGAATRAARTPDLPPVTTKERGGLRLPFIVPSSQNMPASRQRILGQATMFLNEGLDFGRDALQMGTFLRRGAARAGLSVMLLEEDNSVSQSSIFVDYALSDQFSIGLAGILGTEIGDDEDIQQFGLNAEISTEGGAFFQGGITGAENYDPVIGLSIGLRF